MNSSTIITSSGSAYRRSSRMCPAWAKRTTEKESKNDEGPAFWRGLLSNVARLSELARTGERNPIRRLRALRGSLHRDRREIADAVVGEHELRAEGVLLLLAADRRGQVVLALAGLERRVDVDEARVGAGQRLLGGGGHRDRELAALDLGRRDQVADAGVEQVEVDPVLADDDRRDVEVQRRRARAVHAEEGVGRALADARRLRAGCGATGGERGLLAGRQTRGAELERLGRRDDQAAQRLLR